METVLPVFQAWAAAIPGKIHIAPDIPPEKLQKFLRACNKDGVLIWMKQCADQRVGDEVLGVRPVELEDAISPASFGVFAQVDCTTFGGGKDSVVLCWGGLVYKEIYNPPGYVSWEYITRAVESGDPVRSVGLVNPVMQVSSTKITFGGSELDTSQLGQLIGALNNSTAYTR